MNMTEQHRQNYEKLCVYARANIEDKNLEMGSYILKDQFAIPGRAAELIGCGSPGCMLGHAAVLFHEDAKTGGWGDFSRRVFGAYSLSESWCFIFSPRWCRFDNTVEGVCRRIELLLEKGVPLIWDCTTPEAEWLW